ncbi:MAG: hypothetical protein L0Y54_08105 [Sporichthyaceae bacterium]|nr:hypothetical protein [Sporichthyaceae bacterium]
MTNHPDEGDKAAEFAAPPIELTRAALPIGPYTTAWQLVQARPWAAVSALTFAATLGLTRGLTAPPQVILAIFGWVMCVWLAVRPMDRRPAPARLSWIGVLPWAVVILVVAALELYSFFNGSTYEHPTVSSLTDPAFDTFGVRVAFILGWLGAGWHLVRR